MSGDQIDDTDQSVSHITNVVANERSFNFIYSQIVENENDLLGHIAYSLYKTQKISYIKTFKETNHRTPNEEELKAFHMASEAVMIPNRIQAQQILQLFLDTVLREEIEAIRTTTLQNQHEILKDVVNPLKPQGFWKGIWVGVLQSAISTIILAVVIFLLVFGSSISNIGLGPTIIKMISSEPVEQHTTQKIDKKVSH